MTPLEIQFDLRKKGITQKSIADDMGVCQMAVSKVIRKESISDRIMKTIAAKIDRHHYEVFPEYYFSKTRRKNPELV